MATNEDILERLDILISLSIPKFDEAKYPITGLGLEILKLCNGEHTLDDLVKET